MRLIDAEALENEIVKTMRYVPKDAVLDVACMVNRAPTIEAKPVVHAHWEYIGESDGKKIYRCTNCQALLFGTGNFCKECGAQMDSLEVVK